MKLHVLVTYEPVAVLNTALLCFENLYFIAKIRKF